MRKFIITISTIVATVFAVVIPTARADPGQLDPDELEYIAAYGASICRMIDGDPSPPGISHIGELIINDGYDGESAADIVNYTVAIYCKHWGVLLNETREVYTDKGPMKKAR